MNAAVALGIAYTAGSIPSAYIAGRVVKGIDLRTVGSGNLGATNVYRSLGGKVAAVVFAVDMLKGALPAALLPALVLPAEAMGTDRATWWALSFGIAAIVGHAKPVFLLWKGGGKGVATAAGIFAALSPVPLLIALGCFAAVLWRTGYVSAGSLTGAVVLPALLVWFHGVRSPLTIVALLVCIFVFWSHRANIKRLRDGTEHRFGRAKSGEAV
ncbi:MAG: glycerol-3-phosphate 1-O-acyltransferase PlsY [Gemmatimonadaceae bacterium]|nr:glycerol-3-phosphate 1-O-acyltransferase PlsY [Gemmatimonadaceae bacterium]